MTRLEELMGGMDLVISVEKDNKTYFVSFEDGVNFTSLKDASIFTNPLEAIKATFVANSIFAADYEIVEVINSKSAYRKLDHYDIIISILMENTNKITENLNAEMQNFINDEDLKFKISMEIKNSIYFLRELPDANLIDIETVQDLYPYITKSCREAVLLSPLDLKQKRSKNDKKEKTIKKEMLDVVKSATLIFNKEPKEYIEALFNYIVKKEIIEKAKEYSVIE